MAKMKGKHGGARPGAGRRSNVDRKIAQMLAMEKGNCLPVSMMLDLLNFRNPHTHQPLTADEYLKKDGPWHMTAERIDRLMVACAPYFSPRMAPIPYRPAEKRVEHRLDITKLNDEELEWARRISAKAAVPVLVDEGVSEKGAT